MGGHRFGLEELCQVIRLHIALAHITHSSSTRCEWGHLVFDGGRRPFLEQFVHLSPPTRECVSRRVPRTRSVVSPTNREILLLHTEPLSQVLVQLVAVLLQRAIVMTDPRLCVTICPRQMQQQNSEGEQCSAWTPTTPMRRSLAPPSPTRLQSSLKVSCANPTR